MMFVKPLVWQKVDKDTYIAKNGVRVEYPGTEFEKIHIDYNFVIMYEQGKYWTTFDHHPGTNDLDALQNYVQDLHHANCHILFRKYFTMC